MVRARLLEELTFKLSGETETQRREWAGEEPPERGSAVGGGPAPAAGAKCWGVGAREEPAGPGGATLFSCGALCQRVLTVCFLTLLLAHFSARVLPSQGGQRERRQEPGRCGAPGLCTERAVCVGR